MGFFDNDVRNGFDALFDFDRDGNLDPFEQGMEFMALENLSNGRDMWDCGEDTDGFDFDD